MYNTTAPHFPKLIHEDGSYTTTIVLPPFAGMQVRNGPYGFISSQEPSDGELHATSEDSIDPEVFRAIVQWIIDNALEIRALLFPALVKQYWDLRDIVIEYLDSDEDPDVVAPVIENPDELSALCGIVAIHINGRTANGEPHFGIELGCNWENEHGAGVRFIGLRVAESGHADEAFLFPPNES